MVNRLPLKRAALLCSIVMVWSPVPAAHAASAHDQSSGWAQRAYAGSRSPFVEHLERTDGLQLDAGEGYRAWLHVPVAPQATRVRIEGRDWPAFTEVMHAGSLLLQCAAGRPYREPPEPAIPVEASILLVRHPDEGPLPTLTGEPLQAGVTYVLTGSERVVAASAGIDGEKSGGERVRIRVPHLDWSVPDPDIEIALDALAATALAAVGRGRLFTMEFVDGDSDTRIALALRPTEGQAAVARAMAWHCTS